MIVDKAIYVDGRRTAESDTVRETYKACRERSGIAWIGLYKPSKEEFDSVSEEFGLHPLAVEDAIKAHQRPKLEHYGETLFMVLRAARYIDESETVDFGEIHAFVGDDFVITVRHGEASALGEVRERLEKSPELLQRGPGAILYSILDSVVDAYGPVVNGLKNDIDEIETDVFGGNAEASLRIYKLSREVIEFQRATKPLAGMLDALLGVQREEDHELHRYLRDVQDHVYRVVEQVDGFRELLQSILNVNLTLVSLTQNNEVKKISSWAAILFAPTLVGTVYGMNFKYMPELNWFFGYPLALVLMLLVSLTLYLVFRRHGWL